MLTVPSGQSPQSQIKPPQESIIKTPEHFVGVTIEALIRNRQHSNLAMLLVMHSFFIVIAE